jgi:crossover junction endodeoxyribonuclease RuvC
MRFSEKPSYFDATDAVAVAVCHHFQQQGLPFQRESGMKDWKQFLEQHPEKVVGRT